MRGLPRRVVRTKAFAGTAARFAGFAWIRFWAALQIDGHEPSAYADAVPYAAGLAGLLLMAALREARLAAIFADGHIDEEERAWDELTCRTEVDALGLCLSFLVTQLCRYHVGGTIPNPSGAEQRGSTGGALAAFHSGAQIAALAGLAVAAKLASVAAAKALGDAPPAAEWRGWAPWACGQVLVNALSKTTGWLLLFALGWCMYKFAGREDPDMSVQCRTLLALTCSYLSFAVIKLLDVLPGDARWKEGTVQSFALMTGFAWRRCYGLSIDMFTAGYGQGLPSARSGEILLEIAIALPFCAVLLPAYYLYIVPNGLLAAKS